jgi:hypothetical protein
MCTALLVCWAASASAVELFSDNFNADTSGMWTTNVAPAANAGTQQATFAYNYSVMGIPPAPGSVDTLGLRLRANLPIVGGVEVTTRPAGVLSGLSLSPTGKNFGANYQLSFYAWSNYFGAPNGSGLADANGSEGGTANALFAIGTSGTVPLVVGQPGLAGGAQMDGIGFAATTDGAVALDYRLYPKSGTPSPAGTGIYAAEATPDPGSLSPLAAEHAFYAPLFPSQSAPAVQLDLSAAEFADANNTQLGTTLPGTFGFAWHKVVIAKDGGSVTWDIDDERIATFDAGAITLGGNNIAIGVSDVNGTTARHPSLTFTVFDNLVVTDLPGALHGDFNDSGTVDAADLAQWQTDFGVNAESDADGDGDSDGADFLAWQKNLGNTGAAGATAAVPEPATQAIAALGMLAVAGWRRGGGSLAAD